MKSIKASDLKHGRNDIVVLRDSVGELIDASLLFLTSQIYSSKNKTKNKKPCDIRGLVS